SGGTSRSRIEKPPEPGARLHGELVVRDDHAKEIGGAVVDERDVMVGEFEDDDWAVSCTERGPLCRKLSVEGGGELRHEAWVPTRGRRWPLDRHSRRPGEVVTSREIDRRRKRRGRRCRRSELLDRRAEGAGDRDPSLQDTVCEVVVAARCGPISKLERDEDAVVADLDLRSWGGKRSPRRGSRRRGTLIDRRRQDEPHEIVDPGLVGDPAQDCAAVLSAHERDADDLAFDVKQVAPRPRRRVRVRLVQNEPAVVSRRDSEGRRVATHGIDGLADIYECGVTVRQLVPRPLAGCGDALLYPELLGAEVGVCQGAPEIIAGGIPADVRDAVGVHEVDVVDLIARTRG